MTTYANVVTADGPLSYLHLDENITSSSTTVADSGSSAGAVTIGGTYSNILSQQSPPTSYMGGYSMHFNNNSGYLTKTTASFASGNDWTMEVWYKRDTGYAASVNNGTVVQFTATGKGGCYWAIGSGGNFLYYHGGSLLINSTAPGALNDGNWHHIVVTQAAAVVTVYVDGVSKVSNSAAATGAMTSATVYAGAQSTGIGAYLDEFAFYNKALSAAQIQSHYTTATTAPSVSITATPPVFNIGPLTAVVPPLVSAGHGITALPPVVNSGTLDVAAPTVHAGTDAVNVVPAFAVGTVDMPNGVATTIDVTEPAGPDTMTLSMPNPVVIPGANITTAVPVMTVSLAMAAAPKVTAKQIFVVTQDADGYSGSTATTVGIGETFLNAYLQTGPITVPAQNNLTKATLWVNVAYRGTPGMSYQVRRVTSSWAEKGSNFASGTPTVDTTTSWGTVLPTGTGWVSIDITALVRAWTSGTFPNYGLELFGVNTKADTNDSISGHESGLGAYIDVESAPVINASSIVPPVSFGTLDAVAPTTTETANPVIPVPAMTVALSFVGGITMNPDFATTAPSMNVNLNTADPSVQIQYPVTVPVSAIYLGNLENEIVSVNLTTNRLTVATPMSLSLKWPGIYIEGADRYLAKIATTLDQDDIWYKMDEASGNRAIDSEYEIVTNQLGQVQNTAWQQSGYYMGNPQFRISDGPELRPAVHFDGIDDYMVVGPYTIDDTWTDARPDDVEQGMAVTIEFSIRTTQTDGVVFVAGGAGIAGLAAISPSYYSNPHVNGNELRLENGYLTIANKAGTKVKAREFISDGQWHHVVMSIPSGNAFVPSPKDPIQFDGRSPSYLAVDGQPTLVRYGNFLGDSNSWGNYWLPFVVGARTSDAIWTDLANNQTYDVGANALLEMDMRDFIVRLNTYQQLKDTEVIYYEWSNAAVIYPEPMTVNMSTIDPFKVKGNMKKMLALYGLPWGYDYDGTMPLYTYASTLSGMVIEHFGSGSEHVPNGSTFNGHSPVYQTVKTFTVGDYLVFPVDLTGGAQDGGYTGLGASSTYATDVTSVPGVIDRSTAFMKEYPDGTGYGGFADDTTGLPRFINLQTDLVDVADFDLITAVNYPWETPMQGVGGTRQPADAQLCQGSLGMSGVEWTQARNALRDSILQAAYDGANLWVGEYHMAQHLGFIGRYDVHDFGTARGSWDTHARDLDAAHGANSSGYLGIIGEYYPGPQLMHERRVTALIPGLTDLPTTEQGDTISGWSYDRWMANGDFAAGDIVRRPNGLQIGDLCKMGGDGFSGVAGVSDIPFVASGINYGWFNSSVGTRDPGSLDGRTLARQSIISARPDEIVGTPVTREMTGYYGDSGVWIDNPYKDNVLTIAAEVGTVVRGKAIAGRAFIELMETNITPTFVTENQPLPPGQQTMPGVILRYSPSGFFSTWEADTRRDHEVMATLTKTMLTALGGGFGVISSSINYMNFTSTPVIYHRRETMHSRGLNWLAQTRTLEAGDVAVYQTAFLLNLTEPTPAISKTANETVQVSAMRLDMEVRQPKNYLTGDVEERTLPMELSLDMRGRGAVVPASAMTLDLSAIGPVIRAATEIITVFLDADSGPITLFLKEDN